VSFKHYATAAAFRRALEDRLKAIARNETVDLQRLRRQVVFDRFLARIFQPSPTHLLPVALKGGYAMELRIKAARATKDVDLSLRSSFFSIELDQGGKDKVVLARLRERAALDSRDFFEFEVGESILNLDAAPYGGARFPIEARIDDRVFAKFHVDVGIGDAVIEPLEAIEGRDWLKFAGIPRPSVYMISQEQQFAEKLHAYTLPRAVATNTRVRDLVDMVLLIQLGTMVNERIGGGIRITFERRNTHSVPAILEAPPMEWQKPYQKLAEECGLSTSVDEGFSILNQYLSTGGII
jgi:hypothetical protein